MVTPTNGTVTFLDETTRKLVKANIYISDVTLAAVTWSTNGNAGTGSSNYFQWPNPLTVVDVSLKTGPTVVFQLQFTSGGNYIIGQSVAIADQLNTLTTRTPLNVPYKGGSNIGLTQI